MNQHAVSHQVMDDALFEFDGTFSAQLRARLREHRCELGITHQQLGDFLQVSYSTILKWENGKTTACQCRSIKPIKHFLRGDFDIQLNAQYGTGRDNNPRVDYQHLPLADCAVRFLKLYYLSVPRPDLRQKMLLMLSNAVKHASDSVQCDTASDDNPDGRD